MALSAVLLLAAGLALVVGPGAAVTWAAGTRWRDAVASGPAITLAVVAVGTAVTSATDLRWSPLSAAAVAVAALICAAGVRVVGRGSGRGRWRRLRHDGPGDGGRAGDAAGGAGRAGGGAGGAGATGDGSDGDDGDVGDRSSRVTAPGRVVGDRSTWPGPADLVVVVLALVPLIQMTVTTRSLTAIPQNWDAIFHGAAVRYIADTGRAGLTDLAPVSQPANPDFFYPDTYHALTALLTSVPGAAMPAPLNAMSAVTGVVFVLGSAVLAGRLCGGSRLAAVVAAFAAACTWAFPYAVLNWGPLLPFSLGIAVIPGLLVLGARVASGGRGMVPHALLLGAGMAGAWSVHPSIALTAAVPVAVQALVGIVAGSGVRGRLEVLGGFALAALPGAAYALWTMSMISSGTTSALEGFSWPRYQSVPQALGGVLDLAPTAVASVGLGTAVVAGLIAAVVVPAWRRPVAAPVVTLGVFGALYVLAAAVHGDWVRTFTGLWWDDAYRFHAILAVPAVVLAGAGVRAVVPRGSVHRPAARASVVAVVVLGVLAASGQAVVVRDLRGHAYAVGESVSAAERDVLDALGERYHASGGPDGAGDVGGLGDSGGVALNDPFDGTAWVYALHGVPVVFPSPLADDPLSQVGADRMLLYTSMNRYGYEPAVTHTVRDLDVRWVVVSTGVVGGPGRPGGFIGLRHNPHLRLVEDSPEARLYEVLPVPPDHPPAVPPPGIPAQTPAEQPPNTDSPLVDAAPVGAGANVDGADGP